MINKADIINSSLCMTCLCVGRSIREIKDDKMKNYYMDILKEIPLSNICRVVPIICWECEALLKKLLSFREQVKDSYRILHTYTENLSECLLSDVSRNPRLTIHSNDSIVIGDSDVNNEPNSDVNNELNEDTLSQTDNHITDVSGTGPEMVLCDIERYNNKKKNPNKSSKSIESSRSSVMSEKDPVDVIYQRDCYVKLDFINNINNSKEDLKLNSTETEVDKNLQTENYLPKEKIRKKIRKKSSASKKKRNNSLEVEINDIRIELAKEDNIEDDRISYTDLDNMDAEIETMLDEVENESETIKPKKRKRGIQHLANEITTVELSYEELQAERASLKQRKDYQRAKFKCENCIMIFTCASKLKNHEKKHTKSGEFVCSICKTVLSTVEVFTAHYKRHIRRFECIACKKRSSDMKSMYHHMYSVHGLSLKVYKCDICGKISKSVDIHRYHRDSHKARVPCSQCDKTFSHRAGLMNHRIAVHELQKEFPCTLCDKVFTWKNSLKRHMETHDIDKETSGSNRAYCEPCGIGFTSFSSFQRHLRNSLKHVTPDQLKFICDHCKKRFVDKTKLRDHIEEKHLYRTYYCHICKKMSKNRVGLDMHMRSVHRRRPNTRMCHHCGKGFPTQMQLESHIRTHTGERPFMCEYCPTTFSQQSNLYKHHRQVHLNIKTNRNHSKKGKFDGQTANPLSTPTVPLMQYMPENAFIL